MIHYAILVADFYSLIIEILFKMIYLLLLWIRMTEECIGREVCTSIAKSIEPMVDPKDCQTHFKCDENSNIDNHWERHGEARALSINSIKRIIQTKSIRRPKDWYRSKYCNKCERKRSKCFNVRTYLELVPLLLHTITGAHSNTTYSYTPLFQNHFGTRTLKGGIIFFKNWLWNSGV